MVAHKPVSGLAVGATRLQFAFFVSPPAVSAVNDVGEIFEAGVGNHPPRLRLGPGQNGAHHRRAEKDRAIFHDEAPFINPANGLRAVPRRAAPRRMALAWLTLMPNMVAACHASQARSIAQSTA